MQVTTIGLDLAKNVFQVHGIDENGEVALNRALRRAQVLAFFERLGLTVPNRCSRGIQPLENPLPFRLGATGNRICYWK